MYLHNANIFCSQQNPLYESRVLAAHTKMNRHLKPEAEKIRKEIKEMIPETATEDNSNLEKADCLRSDDGRVMYAGEALANKVVTLRHYLGLGSVSLSPNTVILQGLLCVRTGDGPSGIFLQQGS